MTCYIMISGVAEGPVATEVGCYVNLLPLDSLIPACKLLNDCNVC